MTKRKYLKTSQSGIAIYQIYEFDENGNEIVTGYTFEDSNKTFTSEAEAEAEADKLSSGPSPR